MISKYLFGKHLCKKCHICVTESVISLVAGRMQNKGMLLQTRSTVKRQSGSDRGEDNDVLCNTRPSCTARTVIRYSGINSSDNNHLRRLYIKLKKKS